MGPSVSVRVGEAEVRHRNSRKDNGELSVALELHVSAPQKKDYRQDAEAVKEWVEVSYPAIVEQAVRENAEIWWIDQTGARNASNCIKGYSQRGVTPTLPHWGEHDLCNHEQRETAVQFLSREVQSGNIHFLSDPLNQD